jgi:hypothetical protein
LLTGRVDEALFFLRNSPNQNRIGNLYKLRCRVIFPVFFKAPGRFAGGRPAAMAWVIGLILNGLNVFLLIRLGWLALMASIAFRWCFLSLPLTSRGSACYAGISLTGILLTAATAFYASTPPWGADRFRRGSARGLTSDPRSFPANMSPFEQTRRLQQCPNVQW